MINQSFNSLCPFCNNSLEHIDKHMPLATNNSTTKIYKCINCCTLLFYSTINNNLDSLIIFVDNKSTTYIINFLTNTLTIKPYNKLFKIINNSFKLHISDFNSIQDLIVIYNTLILFQ